MSGPQSRQQAQSRSQSPSPGGPAQPAEVPHGGSPQVTPPQQAQHPGAQQHSAQPYPAQQSHQSHQPHQSHTGQQHQPPRAYPASAQPGVDAGVRRPRTGARTVPRTRKARLRVAKADPWSVMKVSFLLSIALGLCTVVAVAVLWMVMDAMGVFTALGSTISDATSSDESAGFDLQGFLSLPRVLTFTGVIAVIDVVLATALATLGAFVYNLSAGFVGGVELTLAEDE